MNKVIENMIDGALKSGNWKVTKKSLPPAKDMDLPTGTHF